MRPIASLFIAARANAASLNDRRKGIEPGSRSPLDAAQSAIEKRMWRPCLLRASSCGYLTAIAYRTNLKPGRPPHEVLLQVRGPPNSVEAAALVRQVSRMVPTSVVVRAVCSEQYLQQVADTALPHVRQIAKDPKLALTVTPRGLTVVSKRRQVSEALEARIRAQIEAFATFRLPVRFARIW